MQQTETYKLNLIETSDVFSPNPLNENMEKLETAITAEAAQRQAADTALDSRVTVLEGRRLALGSYRGAAGAQTIEVGFSPIAVVVCNVNGSIPCAHVSIAQQFNTANVAEHITMTETGFQLENSSTYTNNSSHKYNFIAFG